MIKIKLPFWMDKGELAKIAKLFEQWWTIKAKTIQFPFNLFDEEHCSEWILHLIAYQRDVDRFSHEPLPLFRKRVKYAFINAQEAGSVQGFKNIFERLGIGKVEIKERIVGLDFDIINLKLTDSQIVQNEQLLYEIIRKYGRTCRRYAFLTENEVEIHLSYGNFGHDYYCDELTINL